MPPAAARNFYVIIFDLKTQSRASALETLSTILFYKRLSKSKDQYRIYLINAARSTTNLPEGTFYLDIETNLETVLTELSTVEMGKSDWLEVLDMGIGNLKEWFQEPGIISLQVLFITDLSSFERPNNGKLLEKVIDDLNHYKVFLYVIGPDIEPPHIIMFGRDIKDWMKSLKVDQSNSNLKIMKKIIVRTPNSVLCSYDVGVHLFNSFLYKKGSQPWQVPLMFGTILGLPVSTIRITKKDSPFKLKRTNTKSGYNFRWVYEDQEDVEFVDVPVPGIVKHGKFVKIETDGMFKIEGPRSFLALGFTSAENIPEYLLQSDGSHLVIPTQTQSKEQMEFFSALVDELKECNMFIIARRVYNKDFNPKFVVLIPNSDFNIKCFTLCDLPYADDIAHSFNEQDVKIAPTAEKNPSAFTYLDSINVSGENSKIKVPLAPSMMVDINCLNIIKKVQEKKDIEGHFLEKKFDGSNVNFQNLTDDLKNDWPVRELLKVKKEENTSDDFNEIGDFDFS